MDGEIGEYIVQARRSGEEWFVGAMTNTEARTITLTTDFLKPGTKYRVNLYEDDDKLNTRTKVRTTHKKIKAGDKLTLKLKSSVVLHCILLLISRVVSAIGSIADLTEPCSNRSALAFS